MNINNNRTRTSSNFSRKSKPQKAGQISTDSVVKSLRIEIQNEVFYRDIIT